MKKKNSWNKEYEKITVIKKEGKKEIKEDKIILSKPGIKAGELEQKFSSKVKYMPTEKKIKEDK